MSDPIERAHTAQALAGTLLVAQRSEQAVEVLERAVTDLEHSGMTGTGPGQAISWRLQAQLVLTGYDNPSTVVRARLWAERLGRLDLPGHTPEQRAVLAALVMPAMFGEASAT